MALVPDPEKIPAAVLEQLVRQLSEELDESHELVTHPRGSIVDPESLRTAEELWQATRAVLDRPGDRSPADHAAEANLAYATMLALIDLVKSHTDMPTVPPPRKAKSG